MLARPLSNAILDDLFGTGDVIAVKAEGEGLTLLVQTTPVEEVGSTADGGNPGSYNADGAEPARADAGSE